MKTNLVRKSKNICSIIFFIFHLCLDNFVQSGEFYLWIILFMENLIQSREFYPLKILVSLVQKTLFSAVSLKPFIQCVDFYLVRTLLSKVQTFIQCVDFYSVRRLFYSVETFFPLTKQGKIVHTETIIQDFKDYYCNQIIVQCRKLYQRSEFESFYPVRRLLFSAQIFLQCKDFYPKQTLLSSDQIFIQCVDFYLVQRLLFIAQTFIQCVDFYPVQRLLPSAQTLTFIQCVDFYPV